MDAPHQHTAASSIDSAGAGAVVSRASTPNGSVSVGRAPCPDGKPKTTGPGKWASRSRSTASAVGPPPASSQPGNGAEQQPGDPPEHPRLVQLRQQPIEPVGPLADVFEEEDRRLPRDARVRRAEQRRQLRERAAEQHAAGLAGAEHLEPGRRQGAHRHRLRHRRQQRRAVVAGGAERQAALGHRAVERHRAVREMPGEQRRDVAVADEAPWDRRQSSAGRAAAAAAAIRSRRARRSRRGSTGPATPRRAPRPAPAADRRRSHDGEHPVVVDRLEAEGAQLVGPAFEVVGPHRAGRRDQRDPVADPQPARPPPAGPRPRAVGDHRNPAISAATSWCSSQPTTARQAGAGRRRPAARRRGSAPWRGPSGPGASSSAGQRQRAVLDRFHQRLERRGDGRGVAAADQHAVAAGRDRRAPPIRPAPSGRATPASRGRRSRITPWKPSSPRSRRSVGAESVAGQLSSSDGTSTCAVMMQATSAAIAARNGSNSTASQPIGRMLDDRQLDVRVRRSVSPCPGKCLPQAATPAACSSRTTAAAERAGHARRPRTGRGRR